MDIVKDIIEENAISGKLKMIEKTGGGDTKDTDSPEKSKSKKDLNHHWIKLIQKNIKITLPLSKIDECGMSSMSKHSHETDSIPRKKNQGQYLDLQSKLLK